MFKGFPKEQQLRGLKRRGIVSISGLAIRSLSLGATLVALWVTLPRFLSDVERIGRENVSWKPLLGVNSPLLVVLASSIGVVLAATLSTLLQSRGALGWSLLIRTRRRKRGVELLIAYFMAVVLVVIMGAALSIITLGGFLGIPRATNLSQALQGYAAVLVLAVKLLVVAAVVCAILVSVLTRFFFLVKNRTRSARGAD
jgi:hypothetical protein